MNLVTGYQHGALISRFNSLVRKIEKKDAVPDADRNSITELHNDVIVLNNLYEETHLISEKLRLLADEYKMRQHSARVKLRRFTMKYANK